jgi:hypothetical protein
MLSWRSRRKPSETHLFSHRTPTEPTANPASNRHTRFRASTGDLPAQRVCRRHPGRPCKCWRELQGLVGTKADASPRPAQELVRGEVVLRPDGWTPFVRTLEPDHVATIADDIVRVTEAEVVVWLGSGAGRMSAESQADERQCMVQLLRDAQTFTALPAREKRGLVHMIGRAASAPRRPGLHGGAELHRVALRKRSCRAQAAEIARCGRD